MTTLRCILKDSALRMGHNYSPIFNSRKRKRPYLITTSTTTRDHIMNENDSLDFNSNHCEASVRLTTETRLEEESQEWLLCRESLDKNDCLCSICHEDGDLLQCHGPCLSSFHIGCLGLENIPENKKWLCNACTSNKFSCFLCKQVGMVDTSSGEQKEKKNLVVRCRAISCGKFYHLECAKSHPLSRLLSGGRLICPLHTCSSCKISGKNMESVCCVQCPTSYHTNCIPRNVCSSLRGEQRIVCHSHNLDQKEASIGTNKTVQDSKGEEQSWVFGAAAPFSQSMGEVNSEERSTPEGENSSEGSEDVVGKQKKLKREKKKKKRRRKRREKALRDRERHQLYSEYSSDRVSDHITNRDSVSSRDSMNEDEDEDEYVVPTRNRDEIRNSSLALSENNDPIEAVLGTDDDDEDEEEETINTTNKSLETEYLEKDSLKTPVSSSTDVHRNEDNHHHIKENDEKGSCSSNLSNSSLHNAPPSTVENYLVTSSTATTTTSSSSRSESHEDTLPSKVVSSKVVSSNVVPSKVVPSKVVSSTHDDNIIIKVEESPMKKMSPQVETSTNETLKEGLSELRVEANPCPSDTEQVNRSPQYDRKNKLSPRTIDGLDDQVPMQRSGRAAAAAANSKLLARTHKKEQRDRASTPRCSPTGSSEAATALADKSTAQFNSPGDDEEEVQWVQCDSCKKWRTVPSQINLETLPEQWFCRMNTWDVNYSRCDVAEEQVRSSPTKLIGSHVRRQRSRVTSPLAVDVAHSSVDKLQKEKHRKRKQKDRKFIQCEHPHCGKWRAVPASIDIKSITGAWYCHMNSWSAELASCNVENPQHITDVLLKKGHMMNKGISKLHRSAKRLKGVDKNNNDTSVLSTGENQFKTGKRITEIKRNDTSGNTREPSVSPDYTGLRRSSTSGLGVPPETGKGKRGSKQVVCQWVQCEKCEKWRRLPMHVDVSTLPDKWFCSMNKWNPLLANCDAEEEADQEASAGTSSSKPSSLTWVAYGSRKDKTKLCYRELLFGSNGLLRKAYSDDPSSILNSDGRVCHRDDQYRESSMYRSPKKKVTPPSYFKSSTWVTGENFYRTSSHRNTLEELILNRLTGTQLTRMELAVALHCDYDYSRRHSQEKVQYFPFASIAETLQQLVVNGVVECIHPCSSLSYYKGKPMKSKMGPTRRHHHSHVGGSSLPMMVEPEYEPLYRKMPKKPLKQSKPWKRGKFDPCASGKTANNGSSKNQNLS